MKERVWRRLKESRRRGRLHFTLIDPNKASAGDASRIARAAIDAGSDAILVGGSLGVYEPELGRIVDSLRVGDVPVILFPGNINGLTPKADALLFMYLMNTEDVYYATWVQFQAAPIILEMGLEVIPTAYVIVGHGGAAGYVGMARPVPYDKPELAAAHALAGAMMGARIVYLEAGSGAPRPVPVEAVRYSRILLDRLGWDGLLVVGGGVRDPVAASRLASAGADVLVTGTLVEEDPGSLPGIIRGFKGI
ncbi:MAG: geranylgeranylglyceryl/heptaprenylglyceryl phosphate synthase [Desulfurococcales archaeon]|nr:geranylgeranylglyceryl/heptaprenylglyceryl phosphate synthase [Desulfurococcales archaeon]